MGTDWILCEVYVAVKHFPPWPSDSNSAQRYRPLKSEAKEQSDPEEQRREARTRSKNHEL